MDFDFGHAAPVQDFHSTYDKLETIGEGNFSKVSKAQRRSLGDLHDLGWRDVAINCKQDIDERVSCTSLGGEIVGVFPVPSGELPFAAWLADELITARNQAPEHLHLLTLVDPTGFIFYTQWEFVATKESLRSNDVRDELVITLQWNLKHENVVRLLNVFSSATTLVRVYELMNSSLHLYMKGRRNVKPAVRGVLLPEEVKKFMRQLLAGMEFLHARSIMHRDIKPQTLFIDSRGALKIGGLGLARVANDPNNAYTHEVITIWYRPPEILLGCRMYHSPVDMWSCGCCFAEMVSGDVLFPGDSEIGTIFKIFRMLGTPTEAQWGGLNDLPDFSANLPQFVRSEICGFSSISGETDVSSYLGPDGLELLEGLLLYDPATRLSARAALTSRYLQEQP